MTEDERLISCPRYRYEAALVSRLWVALECARKDIARRELARTIVTEAKATIRCRRAGSSQECQACLEAASRWRRLAQERLDLYAGAEAQLPEESVRAAPSPGR